MPLPFRQSDTVMPNNRSQAVHRFNSLLKTLKRKPQMREDYVAFMEKILSKGHASPVPPDEVNPKPGHVWYLPHFGVYHPKKPGQIRVVFDSSAEFAGVSLNKALLPGPDLMNSLLGVLIRFRREIIAVMCDIEQMFHSFHVESLHRDYLRFLWHQDNNPDKPVIEYRMNVHLFGNGPSPAVATFGLRRTVTHGEEGSISQEVKNFVVRNFYVDDGLISTPNPEDAINLVVSAQAALATANLRLHKVASNSSEVMNAFSTDDRAKDLRDLDLHCDSLPTQRSLGVYWNLEKDSFTFRVSLPDKPFTRRGVHSVINSIYDPIGLAAPVTFEGKKLLQKLVAMGKRSKENDPLTWDDPLPEKLMQHWQRWKDSLCELQHVTVPRCYHPKEFKDISRAELHAFADASQDAIAASVYLRLYNIDGKQAVSFVYGRSRVAPLQSTSIPRLELCGAVLATQVVRKIQKEIDIEIAGVTYYTDSKVVLGYITNESRRFYVYVANRVQIIRSVSTPQQWRYIESERNPADLATRGLKPSELMNSKWLNGPDVLRNGMYISSTNETYEINESDPELRKDVMTHKTKLSKCHMRGLGAERFSRFSKFSSLRRALANIIVRIRLFKLRKQEGTANVTTEPWRFPTAGELQQAEKVLIKTTQEEAFAHLQGDTFATINPEQQSRKQIVERKKNLKKTCLRTLDPFIDNNGIIRVGGRLRRTQFEYKEKHPILLPKGHHVSRLIVRHYHQQVHHQGRQITHGAIRQAGYWLIGGHRMVAGEINACVLCKKLRGAPLEQQMADLPPDRTEVSPPFTNVGFDVFGPWSVCTRRMRGGASNSKRWGLLFTCLSSRAVHVELLESLDTSAFICALRRFFALRGPAMILRCDRGTNFVGAKTDLDKALDEMDSGKIQRFLAESGCEWKFNPPYSSHFGGVWERQIRTIRSVLDAILAENSNVNLTHELLSTFMAEVTAIVNARPIAALPSDVDDPQPLSPAMLLTMKARPFGPPPGEFIPDDLYARQRWRRVQYLADQFWAKWRREYLQNLQHRHKWNHPKTNLNDGDVVLVKDDSKYRNDWPMGRVVEAVKSKDNRVRKATIMILSNGKKTVLLRPIKDLILLVPAHPVTEN